jgi:gamma-glutamylcyclotransferase (GGCT)/AIG2-like uncharacterized protein YtfP
MMKQVFVYGSLMRDGLHADLLARRREARLLGPARCRGSLYDLGGFPTMVPGGRTWVAGELYRCDGIEEILRTLDALEIELGFERRPVEVEWKLGRTGAWAWVHAAKPAGATLLAGGSYKARLRELKRGGSAG